MQSNNTCAPPNTTQSVLNESNVFDDADISVEISILNGDTNIPGGLIFWAKDYSNFYCLCVDGAGHFKISRYVPDRWLQPTGWAENDAINKGAGQVNKLRVVTRARQATAYINDKLVTTIDGQPPKRRWLRWNIRWIGSKFAEYVAVRETARDRHSIDKRPTPAKQHPIRANRRPTSAAGRRALAGLRQSAGNPFSPFETDTSSRVAAPWLKHHRKGTRARSLRRVPEIRRGNLSPA